MKKIQCAVYVRKSYDRGLDMEFNSLDNQEQACKAYIASQSFQGWVYTQTYSDAAISGGTMARPGLQHYAWKYKKQHESGIGIKAIATAAQRDRRTIYKYLNLAYLSPRIINDIMNNKIPSHINLQTLFQIASKYEDFEMQEKEFSGGQ